MDKESLEKQYRKGVITYHEYLLKLLRLENRITEDEYDAIMSDIGTCFAMQRQQVINEYAKAGMPH